MPGTKERSPNYPGLSLSAAILGAQKLWEAEHRSVVPTMAVGRAFGHETMSGPALTKAASLRQYGLIEDVSAGRVKVSEAALPLVLRKPTDPEYIKALREAALRPPLFRELFESHARASDDTLRYHLITDRKFSDEGARKVIRAFRETVAIAKLDGESYNEPQDEPGEGNSPPPPPPPAARNPKPELPEGATVAYSWPLGGNKVQLAFESEPTQDQLQVLLDQLAIMKRVAPQQSAVAAPQPTAEDSANA